MNGFEIEVIPCVQVANVPPEMRVLAIAVHEIDTLDEVDRWIGTCQVLLKRGTRLIFRDIDKVRGDAGIVGA